MLGGVKLDREKAKALLDEAGFNLGRDGVRVNAAGEKLELELMTTAGNQVRVQVKQVIQSQLKAIGVNCPRSTTLMNRLRAEGLYAGAPVRNVREAREALKEVLA